MLYTAYVPRGFNTLTGFHNIMIMTCVNTGGEYGSIPVGPYC